ncbi:MAG: PilT protein [uncultured bacterium]|nr:MAG: PilT protein [uncultured bacterium]
MTAFLKIGQEMINLIDTNIVLRFIVGDNEVQKIQARKIFQDAQKGKINLLLKVVVIAEVCYVLESFYKQGREEVSSKLETFLSQRWIKVEDRKALLQMWKWYRQNMHFVDSFLLASAKVNKQNLLSFDDDLIKKLKK